MQAFLNFQESIFFGVITVIFLFFNEFQRPSTLESQEGLVKMKILECNSRCPNSESLEVTGKEPKDTCLYASTIEVSMKP